jgi:hypothetical protein
MDHHFILIVRIEVEDAGLAVIDPDDSMIMTFHVGLPIVCLRVLLRSRGAPGL